MDHQLTGPTLAAPKALGWTACGRREAGKPRKDAHPQGAHSPTGATLYPNSKQDGVGDGISRTKRVSGRRSENQEAETGSWEKGPPSPGGRGEAGLAWIDQSQSITQATVLVRVTLLQTYISKTEYQRNTIRAYFCIARRSGFLMMDNSSRGDLGTRDASTFCWTLKGETKKSK